MTEVECSEELKSIVDLLGVRAGLSFGPSLRESVERSIRRTMQLAGYANAADYLRFLKADAHALDDLLVATTAGETYFFRDAGQFRIISDLILPDIRRRRGPGHTIRFWSAGCGSGEEAYSLAMLLHRQGALSHSSVLGTDISREALGRARAAVYQKPSLRDQGQEMAKSYLSEREGQHHVHATIKKSVRFESLNLVLDNYPSIASGTRGMDLIMCRNVLSYFDEETIQLVVARIYRSLADGGWLITGAEDPTILEYDMFDFVPTEDGLAYRKANPSMGADAPAPTDDSQASSWKAPVAAPPSKTRETPSRVTPPRSGMTKLAEAKQALAAGDYQRAADLSNGLRGAGAIIHIKALAGVDVALAAKACAAATSKRPLSQELNYLYAVLLMDLNRHEEAVESLRRVLYLDDSLALVHFSLGSALRSLGDIEGAIRAFRDTLERCDCSPAEQPVPLGDDKTFASLRELAKSQLDAIE